MAFAHYLEDDALRELRLTSTMAYAHEDDDINPVMTNLDSSSESRDKAESSLVYPLCSLESSVVIAGDCR